MTNAGYRGSGIRADDKAARSDDDDYTVLDSAILDAHHGPAPSPRMSVRRGSSLADGSVAYPHDSTWSGFALNAPPTGMDPDHLLAHSRAQTLSGLPAAHAGIYSQPPSQWQTSALGDGHPGASGMDRLVEFNQHATGPYANANILASPAPAFDSLNLNTGNTFGTAPGFPASPQSCKEGWMSCSSSDGLDLQSINQHVRTQSPTFAASTHLLRRDGIRKKNARFEIPAERNLRTIDQLINQTSDEQELKELKQQKRLLRNRQAALDSRQRKKQHTERLEEEKKHYTVVISELEDALNDLRMQEAEWARTKDSWTSTQQQYQQYIDSLIMEKEEMVRRHTLETGDLRKKNSVLMEQLQRFEGAALSHAPSSAGYSADFSDFDSMPMAHWEDFPVASEFSIESQPHAASNAMNTSKSDVRDCTSHEDRAVASGFLLMLLLCGAWVASRNSNSAPVAIPSIPDDMRLASANVLDSLYKGSGIDLDGQAEVDSVLSSAGLGHSKRTLGASELAGLSRSSLDSIHQQLTAPSQQQLQDQAFSLTPSQYNELTPGASYTQTGVFEGHAVRNIGDVLGTVGTLPEGSVADTYAKSLLKGKVSTQVLKDFARMVAESRSEPRLPWKSEHIG